MSLKKIHIIIIAALLAPADVVAQSKDGFNNGDDWRAYVDELCRTGEAGVDAANSMFGIAARAGVDAARQYCDCFSSEMTAIVDERGLDWGAGDSLPRGYVNFAKPANRTCFQPFDDGQRFSLRSLPHDQRQAILEGLAAP